MDAGDAGVCDFAFGVTTLTANDRYAPQNVGAIWIATSSGQFVKTLDVWGHHFLTSASAWEVASGGNLVDVVTGATRPTHGTIEAQWNCTDVSRNAVPSGSYEVCVTFAEQPTFPGMPTHEACVNFEVGAGSLDTSPPDQLNFVSMHIVYK